MTTAIHRIVEQARAGALPRVIARLASGWVALGDPQILRGYCVLYPDPVVTDLHAMSRCDRLQFLDDLGRVGEAVAQVTGATRINYEMLGNVEPALHAHVIPRFAAEPDVRRLQPVWFHDWNAAPRFDPVRDGALLEILALQLADGERAAELAEITLEPRRRDAMIRRQFTSLDMDLQVWIDERQQTVRFQLLYDKQGSVKALGWALGQIPEHKIVTEGEPGLARQAIPVGVPPVSTAYADLARRFRLASRRMDRQIAGQVLDVLTQAPDLLSPLAHENARGIKQPGITLT